MIQIKKSIQEAISPERKELNRRVSEIADKRGENITEDDIKFLNDNGLDLKGNKVVIKETGTKVYIPDPWWMNRGNNSNVDWVDKAVKNTPDRHRINYSNQTTSDELKRAKDQLKAAQRWGTDRQEKVWQGKVNREEQRLKDARKNAYTRAWRDEQNADMKQDYETMRRINRKLDPEKNLKGHGYDFDIAWAENRKAQREEELLKRYKDELDELQKRIDDAKQAKQDAIDWKNQKLRKKTEIVDDDITVDEI